MVLELKKIDINNEKLVQKIDRFILDNMSNGEFINTLKYLSYHPKNRFIDDSIVVKDAKSGLIKCVVLAATNSKDSSIIISHPGTTFSGPIFNVTQGLDEINEILDIILSYYENKYSKIEFRLQPTIYDTQPIEDIPYLLLQNDFELGYTALSNVINLTELSDEELIFRTYDSKRRNQVRKTIRDYEYEFHKVERIDKDIWENMNNNLRTKHEASTTHTYNEVIDLMNKYPENIVPYVARRSDNNYGAFALIYKFKNVFHTQYLDTNYELSREYPNLYLIHNLIKLARDEGYTWFSFGPSTEDSGETVNQGLYNFKKGFGGGRILQPRFTKEME